MAHSKINLREVYRVNLLRVGRAEGSKLRPPGSAITPAHPPRKKGQWEEIAFQSQ